MLAPSYGWYGDAHGLYVVVGTWWGPAQLTVAASTIPWAPILLRGMRSARAPCHDTRGAATVSTWDAPVVVVMPRA